MRRLPAVLCLCFVLLPAFPTPAASQDASPPPCHAVPCGLAVDWGSGGAPTFVDRRYGTPADFQRLVIDALTGAGYQFAAEAAADAFRLRLRPRLAKAMCDRVPGTNPDMSCQTIGDLTIDFINAAADADLPNNLRIRNRCGSDESQDIEHFSQYVAAMLDFTMTKDKDRKRPIARC